MKSRTFETRQPKATDISLPDIFMDYPRLQHINRYLFSNPHDFHVTHYVKIDDSWSPY